MSKSYIFLCLALSFVLGVALGEIISLSLGLSLLVLVIIFVSLFWPKRKLRLAGFCLVFILLGALRLLLASPHSAKARTNPLEQKLEQTISRALPEPQASFMAGLLLGARRNIPKNLLDSFATTGTTHIIALSGYNITIIAAALASIFNFLTLAKKQSFWLAMAAIIFFVWLTGFQVSLIRAAIMGILTLFALTSGRLYSIHNALALAGALMILFDPFILLHNISFQLSFLATLGIVWLFPIFSRLGETLGTTLSAQIMVMPLITYYFGNLSLISPLANLLILPLIPLTMLFGFILVLGSFLWSSLAWLLAAPAWLLLTLEIKIIELLATAPFASLRLSPFGRGWLLLLYLALIVWFFRKRRALYLYS